MKDKQRSNITLPVLFLLLCFSFTAVLLIHYSSWRGMWQSAAAVAGLGISVFLWIAILRRNELTLTFPLGGFFFIVIPLLNHFFWKEEPSPTLVIGALLITAGIILLENPYKEREV